jgi:hypothetical protein
MLFCRLVAMTAVLASGGEARRQTGPLPLAAGVLTGGGMLLVGATAIVASTPSPAQPARPMWCSSGAVFMCVDSHAQLAAAIASLAASAVMLALGTWLLRLAIGDPS